MKKCSVCKVEKQTDCFGKHSKRKDGLRGECKLCIKEYSAQASEQKKIYKSKNKTVIAKKMKEWRAANADHVAAYDADWKKNNLTRYRARTRAWARKRYAGDKVRAKAVRDAWLKANPSAVARKRAGARAYDKMFPEKARAKCVKRRVLKRNGTPPSLTEADRSAIVKCYEIASSLRNLFGIDVHVDHIIPIAGGDVSGLHVPWNLRVVHATVNIAKGNRWSESDAFSKTGTFEVCV